MIKLREFVFKMRGFTPVPFVLIALVWAQFNIYLIVFGALISIAGESLRLQSIKYAGGATRTRNVGACDLVTTGPYARMRNPLYFANMLIYIGFALGSGAVLPYLPIATFIFFSFQYYIIIALEEETLCELFDKSYQVYCKNVPRLMPKLTIPESGHNPIYPVAEALRQVRSAIAGIAVIWVLLFIRLY